jgi:ArsR family transcriptional regulator, arsenate/arsenite/antimonite-responsive transcriptional repressor
VYMSNCCPKNWIKFFKAVCDEHRQAILALLHKHGEMNASDLLKKMKLSQPTISHHLKILCDSGAISHVKKGREVYYKVSKDIIDSCCGGFMRKFCGKKGKTG